MTVNVVNTDPTCGPDNAQTTVNTPVTINVLANDADPDPGDSISVTSVQSPTDQGGTATNNGDGDGNVYARWR